MADLSNQAHCEACGTAIPYRQGAFSCTKCYENGLRHLDAEFLDQYARSTVRSKRLLAETCLRALVLADPSDRTLLGTIIYEQFTAAAQDFIGLCRALSARRSTPITQSILGFQLEYDAIIEFFEQLGTLGPTELLALLGLPHPDQLFAVGRGLDKRERKQVQSALGESIRDLQRLAAQREIGVKSLLTAARQLAGAKVVVEGLTTLPLEVLGDREVAAMAIDATTRRLITTYYSVDEDTLQQVVDGIDVLTRLSTNVIFAFVSLYGPAQFRAGFA